MDDRSPEVAAERADAAMVEWDKRYPEDSPDVDAGAMAKAQVDVITKVFEQMPGEAPEKPSGPAS